ncbi:MFS transporter fmqE [Colletotrichum sp. SAR11_59]|nr:MFS transporter fmqE [Colletotrichum sp. SAR11_59]
MTSSRPNTEKPTDAVDYIEDPTDNGFKGDAAVDAVLRGQTVSGYDMNAGIVANKGFVRQFATLSDPTGKPYLDAPILSGWSSIMSVGQVLGMTTIPFVSSRLGRKAAMYTLWLVLASSVLAESLARSWPVWLVGKLLAGIGVGYLQSTLPIYIAEVAPVRIRGGLLMCYSFWWTVGTFCAHVALQSLNKADAYNYLKPIYTQWAQIGLMLLIFVFLPESPAWCVTSGHEERAKKGLVWLNRGVEGFNLEQRYQALLMTLEHERAVAAAQRREKWHAIFRGTDGIRTQHYIGMTASGAAGWGFIGEISSQRLRPYTAGFGAACSCVIGIMMNVLVPYMVNANKWNWGYKTGWFYAGVGLPFTIGMWLLIPDTAGRSAAELDELFERKIKPWRFHKTQTATQNLVNLQKSEQQ